MHDPVEVIEQQNDKNIQTPLSDHTGDEKNFAAM
jgi:hypothetical protein